MSEFTSQQQFDVLLYLGIIAVLFGPVAIFQLLWGGRGEKR